MSIASELNRLLQAKSDLATSIAAKGVTVPAATTIDGYAALVDQIQQGGGTLPYDAEIEYLQSSGTQYINTEFVPNNQSGFYLRAYCTTSGGNHMAFGCRQSSGDTRWSVNFSRTLEICWNTYTFYEDYSYINKWVEIENNFLNNRLGKVDGVTVRTSYSTLANIVYPACVFMCNTYGSMNYSFTGRISNVKISQENEVMMDFIPVRIGTKGYLYDKVSKRLFGNAGTGSFTLGPDIT